MITCEDILNLKLDGMTLVAGEAGLGRMVSWTYRANALEQILRTLDAKPQFAGLIQSTCILGAAYSDPRNFGQSYQEAKNLIAKKELLPNPKNKKVLSASSMGIYKYMFNSGCAVYTPQFSAVPHQQDGGAAGNGAGRLHGIPEPDQLHPDQTADVFLMTVQITSQDCAACILKNFFCLLKCS